MKAFKRFIFLCLLLLCFSSFGWGNIRGIEHMGSSSRMLGLGQISVVGSAGIEGIFENPALLDGASSSRIGFMTARPYREVSYQVFGATLPMIAGLNYGIGIQRAFIDDIYHTVQDENTLEVGVDGTFSYISQRLAFAMAGELYENLSIGLGLSYHMISAGEHNDGSGISLGMGLRYKLFKYLSIGLFADNIVGGVTWLNGTREPFSRQLLLGMELNPFEYLSLVMSAEKEQGREIVLKAGVEYRPFSFLKLRGGSYQQRVSEKETVNNITLGVGLDLDNLSLDYAYKQDEEYSSNSTHYFSIGFSWGGDPTEETNSSSEMIAEDANSIDEFFLKMEQRSKAVPATENLPQQEAEQPEEPLVPITTVIVDLPETQTVNTVTEEIAEEELTSVTEDVNPVMLIPQMKDLPVDHWALQTISKLNENGVMIGYPDSKFYPGKSVSYGELLTVIVRAKGYRLAEVLPEEAIRLPGNAWVKSYLKTATQHGIITGDPSNFDPSAEVTRAKALELFYKWLTPVEAEEQVHSAQAISDYLESHDVPSVIADALKKQVLIGVSKDKIDLQLDRSLTRAELAKLLELTEEVAALDSSSRHEVIIEVLSSKTVTSRARAGIKG